MRIQSYSPFQHPSSAKFEAVCEKDEAFFSLFPHRHSYLWAAHPREGDRADWRTETRHPLSDRLINQGAYLFGVRFGAKTRYLMIDIDLGSRFHPFRDPFAIGRLVAALEPLGLYAHIAVSSSYSGGLHLYFPLPIACTSWAIARAARCLIENQGYKVSPGQVELFPNSKGYSVEPTEYNGHRLPLQAGSYLLNPDYQPICGDRQKFVQMWRAAESLNCITAASIERVLRQSDRSVAKRLKGKAEKFLADLNAEIEAGWTEEGQTNNLLGRIATRCHVFGHLLHGGSPLRGEALASAVYATAEMLPGFDQFCGHQRDLVERCRHWARCAERRYYPFGEKQGDRAAAAAAADDRPVWNDTQAANARDRIRLAVERLCIEGTLPIGLTARRNAVAISAGCSVKTCYRNRDLWAENQPEPLQRKEDHPIVPQQDDLQRLEPLQGKEDHPINANKLYRDRDAEATLQASRDSHALAVGGSGGEDSPPDEPEATAAGVAMIRASLAKIAADRKRPAAAAVDVTPPDENYFAQQQQQQQQQQQRLAAAAVPCEHPRAIIGLDAHYCPDCGKSVQAGTRLFEEILRRSIDRWTQQQFEILAGETSDE